MIHYRSERTTIAETFSRRLEQTAWTPVLEAPVHFPDLYPRVARARKHSGAGRWQSLRRLLRSAARARLRHTPVDAFRRGVGALADAT